MAYKIICYGDSNTMVPAVLPADDITQISDGLASFRILVYMTL